ncbi:AlkA N-terminal domain-containing protein [Saccharopolyspora sp. NPDC000995]
MQLPFWAPLCPHNLFGHLAATAVPEVVEWRDGVYRRTLRLPHGHGVVALRPQPEYIDSRLPLNDLRDLAAAITRCRWLLGLELRRGGEGRGVRRPPDLGGSWWWGRAGVRAIAVIGVRLGNKRLCSESLTRSEQPPPGCVFGVL